MSPVPRRCGSRSITEKPRRWRLARDPVDLDQASCRLEAGDALVLYSDGALPKSADRRVQFERVARSQPGRADVLADAMLGPGGWEDDVTVLVLKVLR